MYFPPNFFENPVQKFNHFAIVNDGQELYQYIPHIEKSILASETDSEIIFVSVSQQYFTKERYIEFSKVPCNATACPGVCSLVEDFKNVGGGLDDYLDWIEQNFIPYLISKFPQLADRVDSSRPLKYSMYGTSFGGYAAGNACYYRPDKSVFH